MNWWERFKFIVMGDISQKAGIGAHVPNWQAGQPQYPQDDYRSYANNGYSKNELVYACIQEVASAVPDAPLMLFYEETDEKEKAHPLRQVLKNPNPWQTEYDLWEMSVLYLLLAGNAYWEKVRDRTGRVVELVPLQPDRVRVVPNDEVYIGGYIYEVDGKQFPLDKSDVVHFSMPNPNPDEGFLGMPPLRAALRAIATDNEATDFTKTILQNYAMPAVVITTQSQIDDELANRLTRKWKQKFGGKGQGEPAFLQEGMTINAVGLSLRDLEFPDLRTISETRICAVFGVPPILVGAAAGLDRSTFSNYEEARRSFWQETIMPLLQKLSQRINKDLVPEFNEVTSDQFYAGFDTSEVSALQSLEHDRWERTIKGLEKGLLTRNEARTKVGLDEVQGGDVFLQPANIIGVPEGEAPQTTIPTAQMDNNPLRLVANQNSKKKKGIDPRQDLAVLQHGFEKINFAIEAEREFEKWAKDEFKRQGRDVMRAFNRNTKAFNLNDLNAMVKEMVTLSAIWFTDIQASVFKNFDVLLRKAAKSGKNEIAAAFDLPNDEVLEFTRDYVATFAKKISDTSAQELSVLFTKAYDEAWSLSETRDALLTKFSDWEEKRAVMVARSETIRASNAGALFSYEKAGIEWVEWIAAEGDACPFCQQLNGTIIPIGSTFLDVGESIEVEVDGKTKKLNNNYEPVKYPPAHPMCRCSILASEGPEDVTLGEE